MDYHTQGPWYFWTDGDICEVIPSEDPNETPLCFVDRPSDAHLIAAAPDLLAAALEAIAAWDMEEDTPEHNQRDRLDAAIGMMRAAIAKSRGDA
jgi:hypothetical protein